MTGRFEKRSLIGTGTFGKVYLSVCRDNGQQYAVKEVRVQGLSKKDVQQVMTEVSVLAYSKHVNIIRYKTAYIERGLLNVVMEYADDGDLHRRIQTQKRLNQHLPEEIILGWFIQICSGICYLHGKNILHRDLKTQNIFLTKSQTVKIGDFGISKILEHTQDHAKTAVGTPYYLSPEICQRQPYNQKSDMWAIGCVLYEMTCLRYPFEGQDFNGLVVTILQGKFQPVPETYSCLIRDLISVLLQSRTEQRPSAEQILCIPDLKLHMDAYIKHLQTTVQSSPRPGVTGVNPKVKVNLKVDKENVLSVESAKARKHSLATPRTRQPLKEKRCYSNEENSTMDNSKRQKIASKPAPVNSLYKKAIIRRTSKANVSSPLGGITNQPVTTNPITTDVLKNENEPKIKNKIENENSDIDIQNTDVDMEEEDVFVDESLNTVIKKPLISKTYTLSNPKILNDVDVMKILYFYGLTDKDNLVQTSEGLRYFLEQRMGCDQFFRLYLALKDQLQDKNGFAGFKVYLREAGVYWPVLYHLVQLDHLSESV